MKPTFSYIILALLFTFIRISVDAQGTLDKLKFEEAEAAYINKNYSATIEILEELETKGLKNPTVLHLKILAVSKLPSPDFDQIVQFKEDVKFYLENYDIEGLEDKYKEIYSTSKTLSSEKYNEIYLAALKGEKYYKVKDFKNAFIWYNNAANGGHSSAQYNLAVLYEYGQGVEKNIKKAILWYEKSANSGNQLAQEYLGKIYSSGKYVDINISEAIKWFTQAAEQGNVNAQYELGIIYCSGSKEILKDYKKGIFWLEKSIENGYVDAVFNIETMYLQKEGNIPLNTVIKLLEIGANSDSRFKISYAKTLGDIYLNEETVRNYNQSSNWYFKSAKSGNVSSMESYWQFAAPHLKNEEIDIKEWITILENLLNKKSSDASLNGASKITFQLLLSSLYSSDSPLSNETKSNFWFEEALKLANERKFTFLGSYYYGLMSKNRTKVDFVKLARLYQMEISIDETNRYNMSKFNLGLLYYEGLGVENNFNKAFEMIDYKKGILVSEFHTALMYFHGKGVKKDKVKALEIYRSMDISKNPNFFTTIFNLSTENFFKKNYVQLSSDVLSFLEFLKEKEELIYK